MFHLGLSALPGASIRRLCCLIPILRCAALPPTGLFNPRRDSVEEEQNTLFTYLKWLFETGLPEFTAKEIPFQYGICAFLN